MSEINFRHKVRDILKPAFVLQVENVVGTGTPDTYYAFDNQSGWLELKIAATIPARPGTVVFKSLNRGLELEQEATLYEIARHGGNSWALAKIVNKCYLVPGMIAHDFNVMTMPDFQKFEINLCDLRAVLKSYASVRTIYNHNPYKAGSFLEYSLWYEPRKYVFRPRAEGIFCREGNVMEDARA